MLKRLILSAGLLAAVAAAGAVVAVTRQPTAQPATASGDLTVRRLLADERPVSQTLAGAQWYDSEWGWIVVADDAAALEAASDLRAAVAAHYQYFGLVTGRGAILDARFVTLAGPLKAAGAVWVLPWAFDANDPGRADGASASGRTAAARLVAHGLCEPLPDLASVLEGGGDEAVVKRDDGHHPSSRAGLRHEIGHALFNTFVMPGPHEGQYGSSAPDWLDEAAAELGETPDVVALRRRQFAQEVETGRLPRLSVILTQTHPLFRSKSIDAAINRARADAPKGPMILTVSLDQVDVSADAVADFYANARAATDFLIAMSGDDRLLDRIAVNTSKTGQPLAWLSQLDRLGRLPRTINGLDAAFAIWAQGHGGA